jgi:hypothetical protein
MGANRGAVDGVGLLSDIVSARAMATLSQMPEALHRRRRRKIEFQLPYLSGTSRQGAPVRSRHKMTLITLRLC